MSLIEIDEETTVVRADFLESFAAIHEAMRRDARRLPAVVACVDEDTPRQLVAWYARYRGAIEHHHAREDELLWPALVERSPGFAEAREVLEADHVELDDALEDMARALAGLADGTRGRASLVPLAVRLRDLLVDHLAREEAAAFPRLSAVYTPEEWEEIERQFMKGSGLRELAFEVPWVLGALPAEAQADMIAGAPWLLRVLNRLVFTPRYRRLSAVLR
jgi:hemerythrin-like domain-containing protein